MANRLARSVRNRGLRARISLGSHGSRGACAPSGPDSFPQAPGADSFISLRRRALTLSFPSDAGRSLRSLGLRAFGAARGRALRACGPVPVIGRLLVCGRRETPDHGAVHGARCPRQDRAMVCGSDRASAGGGRNGGTAGWRPAVRAVLAAAVGGIDGGLPGGIPPCPREARFSSVHRPRRAPPGRPRLSSAGSSRGCGSARAPAAARTRARCWGAQGVRCPARGSDSRRRRPRCRPW